MKHHAILTALTGILLTSSCDKHNQLLSEKAQVEAEIARKNEEIHGMDANLLSYGGDPVSAKITLDRQTSSLVTANQQIEKQLAEITSRCTAGEASVERLKVRVAAYQANNLR
jgi:hypothetical protein